MRKDLYGLGLALTLLLSGCSPASNAPATPQATSTTTSQRNIDPSLATVDLAPDLVANQDQDRKVQDGSSGESAVAYKALEGNQAEQQLASLALERSQNDEVKNAAQMIQSDHRKAENQLRDVADTNLPPPRRCPKSIRKSSPNLKDCVEPSSTRLTSTQWSTPTRKIWLSTRSRPMKRRASRSRDTSPRTRASSRNISTTVWRCRASLGRLKLLEPGGRSDSRRAARLQAFH